MSFNIRDEVRVIATGEIGVITDRMFSEAKDIYMYVLKPRECGRSCLLEESALEPYKKPIEYKVKTEIADNVVICIIYEIDDDLKTEVCRGHGHIIHECAEGIAQALSYASKQAFMSIDTGIYMKQRRKRDRA